MASFIPSVSSTVLKPGVAHAMFMDATHDNDPGHILVRGGWCVNLMHAVHIRSSRYSWHNNFMINLELFQIQEFGAAIVMIDIGDVCLCTCLADYQLTCVYRRAMMMISFQ